MKKKLLAISLVSVMTLASASANALYVGGSVGTFNPKFKDPMDVNANKIEANIAYSFVAGMELPVPMMPVRAEVEYLNLRSKVIGGPEDSNLKTNSFGVNAYVGLPIMPIVSPYIGFGLSSMKQTFDIDSDNSFKSKRTITPQYMVGLDLSLPLVPVAGGIEYRYINKEFKYSDTKTSLKANTFLAKLRFKF